MRFKPTSKTIVQESETLVALGEVSGLYELEELARAKLFSLVFVVFR